MLLLILLLVLVVLSVLAAAAAVLLLLLLAAAADVRSVVTARGGAMSKSTAVSPRATRYEAAAAAAPERGDSVGIGPMRQTMRSDCSS